MHIYAIPTPALILDRAVFDENRAMMRKLLEETGLSLRPHYKSHKCPAIARLQLEDGAVGITCAKLGEASDLAANGIDDILIANQIVDPDKLVQAASLAAYCTLRICVETAENVLALQEAAAARGSRIHVLVEYEIGMKRCGVQTHEEVLSLARLISQQENLIFDGIQAYAGNMAHEKSLEVRRAASDAIDGDLRLLREKLCAAGMPPLLISGGSTGTVQTKERGSVYTEMQCGSYLFMDRAYKELFLCFRNALFLLTTVMSVRGDRFVTDGGVKSLGMDQGDPLFVGFENCRPGMSEEHSQIDAPGHGRKVGDRQLLIPGHCCTTFNLHDKVYVVQGNQVTDIWEISARGKSW